jgi:predicted aspartyl protease
LYLQGKLQVVSMRSAKTIGAILLAYLACSIPALAEDCKLMRLTSVDFTAGNYGSGIFVPVSIGGQSRVMAIDTGSPLTAVDPQAATDLGLITHRIYQGVAYDSAGETFQYMAELHDFTMGTMHSGLVKAIVWPSQMWSDKQVAGTIGADMLHNYDVDIDFPAGKFGLFSQDHCPGKVVYWPAAAVAVVPIHVVNSGHIIVPVTIDGQEIDAVLDTGAFGTILTLEGAKNRFGLDPSSPGMTMVGHRKDGTPTYTYTFRKLELEGITITNPVVHLWEDELQYKQSQNVQTGSRISDTSESNGKTELILGVHELRNLHIYIAYQEQKLYISAGDASPVASSNPAADSAAAASAKPH